MKQCYIKKPNQLQQKMMVSLFYFIWNLRLFLLYDVKFHAFIAEVLLLDTEVVVFKSGVDCKFYVSGLIEEVQLRDILIMLTID